MISEASSLLLKAGVLNAQGRFFEALLTADSSLALMPGDTTAEMLRQETAGRWAQVCLNSARDLRGRGLILPAEQAYLQATTADSLCVAAHTELASLYTARGMTEKCLEHARKAVDVSPEDPAMRVNLAVACINCGRHAEAEKQLLSAVAMDESYGRAHYYLAELFRETGRSGPAQAAAKRARELGYGPPRR
jgi:tetratricopeptide (TPR) repeat protein